MSRSPGASQQYWSWTLQALVDLGGGPVGLKPIYRQVDKTEHQNVLREGTKRKDFEYEIRWALSNMQKKNLVRNSTRGEWEITDTGRDWLRPLPEDFGDDLV